MRWLFLNDWKLILADFPHSLSESVVRNYRYSRPRIRVLALFAIIGEPLYFFTWRTIDPSSYESLPVRLLGGALCIPLLFDRRVVRRGYERQMALCFAVAATYCLPFVFCYLLLQNAHLAVGDTPIQWPLQYTVSLILLVLLFPSGPLAGVLFLTATLLAWVTFLLTGGTSNSEVIHAFWELLPIYLFILAAGTVFNTSREVIELEKLRAIADVTNNMAHELRTPFLGIKALAQGIGLHMPSLLQAYDLAIQNHLTIEPIRSRHLRRLKFGLREIETETNHSNSIIDRLLINATEKPVEEHVFETFSARECVLDALHRYPFAGRYERDLVAIDLDQDFIISAPPVLVVHVLFNLLKNSLYYVQKAGTGDVTITLIARRRSGHKIIVHDTGTGIPPQIIRRIFDRFFTTTEAGYGAGIGLSFCKMVMDGLGGSIVCKSALGHYTNFVLTFPHDSHA